MPGADDQGKHCRGVGKNITPGRRCRPIRTETPSKRLLMLQNGSDIGLLQNLRH